MIKTHEIYYPLYNDKEHFIILITGGRGSGKSYGAAAFIERLTFELSKNNDEVIRHGILYSRYTMVSAGISVIPEMLEKIELDGTSKYFHATKTDIINKSTKSHIMFRGIKTSSGNQTAKLKSIHGITTFVCDEAEEWRDEADFDKILLSIRQKGIQNRVIIIMNPCDVGHFIYRKYIEKTHKIINIDGVPVQISTHPNVLHIHTTYLDNIEYLSPQFISEVETMKVENPSKYANVVMGRWADLAEGIIFKNWDIISDSDIPKEYDLHGTGIDFGYTNGYTAIVECTIVGNDLYLKQRCYQRDMTTADLIRTVREINLPSICDSADPRLIDELCISGNDIYAVEKPAGSILAGISKMQSLSIHIEKESFDLLNEFRNYVWEKNKEDVFINKAVDANNHGIDAARYFVYGMVLGKSTLKNNINANTDFGIY